jgi:hypothetical protein
MAVFAQRCDVSLIGSILRLKIMIRAAKAVKELRSRTSAELYSCETLLERVTKDLEDVPAALREFIQEEHAAVGQRHLTGQPYMAAADHPRIRDGGVGSATRMTRDQRCAAVSEAGDAVDACGFKGLGEGHRRQDGGEPRASIKVQMSFYRDQHNLTFRLNT